MNVRTHLLQSQNTCILGKNGKSSINGERGHKGLVSSITLSDSHPLMLTLQPQKISTVERTQDNGEKISILCSSQPGKLCPWCCIAKKKVPLFKTWAARKEKGLSF